MASAHFRNLEACLHELKAIYLDKALAGAPLTDEQQELARAFVVFAHAEFEHFVEKALADLADCVLANARVGKYSAASLSLLSFSALEPLTGGGSLTAAKKADRSLLTRLGDARSKLSEIINGNTGVREKYVAKMAVPLGLNSRHVDSTWINDLDTFCSWRGAYAHISRLANLASPLGVNPSDVWLKCESLTWNSPIATPGLVSSFQGLDEWIEKEMNCFAATFPVAVSFQSRLVLFLKGLKSAIVRPRVR